MMALLVLACLRLIGFVIVQVFSGERATVPTRVFLRRNIWSSALFCSCVSASLFVMLYYVRHACISPTILQTRLTHMLLSDANLVPSHQKKIRRRVSTHGHQLHYLPASPPQQVTYTQLVYQSVTFMSIGAGLPSTLQVDSGHAK